jgi:hypothetical protein
MNEAVICYPRSFLERPEDRRFLMELKHLEAPEDSARLYLYRLWADYATGGSDRREITHPEAEIGKDGAVRLLEDFCGWVGVSGDLVRAALAAGFLSIDSRDGKRALVCTGFFPINSAWCRDGKSMQKKGGLARAAQNQKRATERDAAARETLWLRRNDEFDVTPEQRGAALRFVMRLCRAVNLATPDDEALRAGPFRKAAEILDRADEATVERTLLWLISNRSEPDIPQRIDQLLRGWDTFVSRAQSEMG